MEFGPHINSEKFIIALSALITREKKKRPPKFGVSQSTSRIARDLKRLLTSSLITFCLSSAKLLIFCLTGLKEGATFSLLQTHFDSQLHLPCPLASKKILPNFDLRSK